MYLLTKLLTIYVFVQIEKLYFISNGTIINIYYIIGIYKDTEYKIRNLKFKLSSRKKMQGNEKNIGF